MKVGFTQETEEQQESELGTAEADETEMMMNGLHSSFPRFWISVQSMVFCQLQEIH